MKESLFYSLAREAENCDSEMSIERIPYWTIQNSEAYTPWLGLLSRVQVLEANLRGKETKNISVVSSPEAEAVSGAGCFIPNQKTGGLKFVLPRYHLGIPAQLDMEVAVYQIANTRIIREIIEESTSENSGIIYFAREGGLTQMQKAVYLTTGENLPTTLISISHKKAENEYTREAYFASEPNLEGFPDSPEILYLCDPVASGMQHVAMIEKLEEMGKLPKKIVIIAPMATRFGLEVIERVCIEKGVEFAAGVAGVLLDTQPPLRYYSPYPKSEIQAANPDLHILMTGMFQDKLDKACIRCNWTGTFWGGMSLPMEASDQELRDVGLSNEELLGICGHLTDQAAGAMGIMKNLLPYSTKMFLRKS